MKQRILAILLSLTMMFTLVPTAWALSEEENRTPAPMATSENGEGAEESGSVAPEMYGNCGADDSEDSVQWALTPNNADSENPTYTLTISGSGDMANYTANINNGSATQPWRTSVTGVEISNITKVVVSEGVTSIGDFAFNGLTAVSEYVIGANVSAINQWALDTSAAKVFNLNGNTNFQTDVDGVLFSEDGKTLIAYPGGSAVRDEYTVPSTVATISDGAFVGCPIKKLTIDSNVKTALPSWSFNGGKLEELDVNCPFGNSTFARITTLKKVTLGDSITEIPQMAFLECKGLQTVSIPSGLTKIGTQAFFGCSSLQNVTLPASLTEIGYRAFRDCAALTSITFPDNLTKIGIDAFSGCTGLTYISYGSGINDIGINAFGGCTGVNVIDLHRATKIGEKYDNGSHEDDSDLDLTHACIRDANEVKYYLRTVNQANSVKGNLEWGNNVAGGGNTTNTYYILTATDAVPDYTDPTGTPTRAGYTFSQWNKVTVNAGSHDAENVYTDAGSWSLASPTVTVSPASANTYVGGSAVTLTATVSEPVTGFTYSYQWYRNTSNSTEDGTAISEATSETYSPNIAAGTTYYYCVVTVENGSDNTSATTAVIPVTVAKQAGSVTISNNKTAATYGDKPFTFNYTASKTATVTSSDPSVATVQDNNGTVTVTIVGAGTTEISVSFDADTNYSAASNKFTLTVNKAVPTVSITAEPASLVGGGTVKLTVSGVPEGGTVTVTQTDDRGSAAKTLDLTANGEISVRLSNTTAKYTFTVVYAGGDNYNGDNASCEVSVTRRHTSSVTPGNTVSVPSTPNGTVTVSPSAASKGETVTITTKPSEGYELSSIEVLDKNGDSLKLKDLGNGKYSFVMPDGKVSVEAEFVKTAATSFADVPANAYFADAVKWAVDKGITNGLSDTMFGPYASCTRAQIVTFLWRAAGSPEPKTASSFTDVPVSTYYAKAVAWAVENGITNGMTETTFAPDATCTRGQSVTFLHRVLKGTASGSTNFTDVKSDAFYADAINWAVANNVTNGTSNTTFSPNADCTRAEIVTFLYRAYQGK